MSFIILRYVLSVPILWRIFIINGCWVLWKVLSASIEIIIWFFSSNLLIWCITSIDMEILKSPCSSGIKSIWSWCMIFLTCCWILFAILLLMIFASMFIIDIDLQFSCFAASLFGFGIRVMLILQNEFRGLPFSAIFWKSLSRIGISSLNFGRILPWICLILGFYLLEEFWL